MMTIEQLVDLGHNTVAEAFQNALDEAATPDGRYMIAMAGLSAALTAAARATAEARGIPIDRVNYIDVAQAVVDGLSRSR